MFEFKVVKLAPEGRALQQTKDRGHADKHRAAGQPIHLIGVEFSREQRCVVGFEVESLEPPAQNSQVEKQVVALSLSSE